jgi:ATP-binding protein involved in chromosome partitioning
MSAYIPEGSNEKVALFGEGGGEETANRLSNLVGADVPLLGKIPFDIALREGGDTGNPVVLAKPESPAALEFEAVIDQLTTRKKSLLGVRLGLST